MRDVDSTEGSIPPSSTPEADCPPDPLWNSVRTVVESDILPRLLQSPLIDAAPASFVARAESPGLHPRFADFLRLVRSEGSDPGVWSFVTELLEAGDTVETVHATLLSPVAREMGVLWEQDECDFTEVAIVCSRLQRVIRRIASQHAGGLIPAAPRVLVSALPGSHHTLGPLMVAESLSGHGIDVSIGEPFVSDSDPSDFEVVAISVARAEELDEAQAYMRDLRARSPEIRIIVGGAAFREDPAMVNRIGADGWAEDAAAAAMLVHEIAGTSDPQASGSA